MIITSSIDKLFILFRKENILIAEELDLEWCLQIV